ncbi:MAG: hypothetical protein HY721_25970 [Planctomycetes bacterium]|nr:hypothetical protein [Planctomycetota bacterium]
MTARAALSPWLAGLAAALAGCHGYLRPYDDTPLPARSAPTRGGGEVEVKEGEVFLRPGRRDIGARLGVELAEEAGRVVVARRLRPDAALEPGDRIASAAAAEPFASPLHAVRSLADLAGYAAAEGWLTLELQVERGGAEVAVREKVRDERRRLPVRRWDPRSTFRRNGIELGSLADWDPQHVPPWAEPGDHLVLRVDVGSRAAQAGLRPLDVVANARGFERAGRALLRAPGGAPRKLTVRARPPRRDLWLPLLLSWEADGARTHVGLGPIDAIFHYSSTVDYDAATDAHETTSRWSLFSVIGGGREGGGRWWNLDPSFDMARLDYAYSWATDRSRPDLSASWAEAAEMEDLLGAE